MMKWNSGEINNVVTDSKRMYNINIYFIWFNITGSHNVELWSNIIAKDKLCVLTFDSQKNWHTKY